MRICCVKGCTNRINKPGLKFFRIPSGSHPFKTNRRRLWLQAINRKDWTESILKYARICGAHFISGEPSLDSQSPDFVPSIFAHRRQSRRPEAKLERYHRKIRRDDRASGPPVQSSMMEQHQNETADNLNESSSDCVFSLHLKTKDGIETQEGAGGSEGGPSVAYMDSQRLNQVLVLPSFKDLMSGKRIDDGDLKTQHSQLHRAYIELLEEAHRIRSENDKLRLSLQSDFSKLSYNYLKWDSKQLSFHTGLPPVVFDWLVLQMTRNVIRVHPEVKMEDHLLIVLMKLKWVFATTIWDTVFKWTVS
ncbi:hypothetical protein WMY93_014870 [Mugilogobius chulae]|uniref:THAP-type domain-containing protein n=1 Tax=Mugilogobius chulae TaxID=88201 RepID=A0AAW0NVT8_9GOBI